MKTDLDRWPLNDSSAAVAKTVFGGALVILAARVTQEGRMVNSATTSP